MAQMPDPSAQERDSGPTTVPVLIDDQKKHLPGFEMTRCVYLAIDYDGLEADWFVGQPLASRILLSEFAGIITAPEDGGLFTSGEQIDRIFDHLERQGERDAFTWVIEFEDLWIPNWLVKSAIGEQDNPAGNVLRVGVELVRAALRFSREQISLDHYLEICQGLEDPVSASPGETEVFKRWGTKEIVRAADVYKQNLKRQDVLRWRDDKGSIYLGDELVEEDEE